MSREQTLERERRWARPAAFAAFGLLVLYVAGLAVQQGAGLPSGNSEAEQLGAIHDHSSAIVVSAILQGLALALLPVPLLYLFRAAQARNPRVQGAFVGFVVIGPLLFAAQTVIGALAIASVSSDYADSAASEQAKPLAMVTEQAKSPAGSLDKVTIYTAKHELEVEQSNGSFYKAAYPADQESKLRALLESKHVDLETDTDTDTGPPDALADHLTSESNGVTVAQGLLLPAALGFIVAIIYTSLQALRVGLLTRFTGSLGIALGAAFILLGKFALIAILAWTGYLGLLYLGRQRGPRPPAWDAGEAIPWPRPGEEPAAATSSGGQAVEGEATEVGEGEPTASASASEPQRAKRKRKRRS